MVHVREMVADGSPLALLFRVLHADLHHDRCTIKMEARCSGYISTVKGGLNAIRTVGRGEVWHMAQQEGGEGGGLGMRGADIQ